MRATSGAGRTQTAGPSGARAAIYLRVSTGRQETENQVPEIEQLVRARGYDVVEVFEEAVSATKHRPELERLLAAAHAGKFTVLVVWSIDRLGRSMVGNLDMVLKFDRLGIETVSVKEAWLSGSAPVRELLLAIVSWVAEQERRRIGERTRAGLDRARRKGMRLGRPRARISLPEARALLAAGLTRAKAARKLGVSETTLRRALRTSQSAFTKVDPELAAVSRPTGGASRHRPARRAPAPGPGADKLGGATHHLEAPTSADPDAS